MREMEKKLLKLKKRMEECDHLFIKEEEGFWAPGFHSSDYEYIPTVVTCLKCGLNNKPRGREYDKLMLFTDPLGYYWDRINDEIFKKQYPSSKKGESTYNFISDEKFRAINPVALYQIATYINPNGTNEEIFNTMKELREIQHKEGRFDINNKELLDSLKDILSNEKRLIKK